MYVLVRRKYYITRLKLSRLPKVVLTAIRVALKSVPSIAIVQPFGKSILANVIKVNWKYTFSFKMKRVVVNKTIVESINETTGIFFFWRKTNEVLYL